MSWAKWSEQVSAGPERPRKAGALAPDGRHVGEITRAWMEDKPWDSAKSEDNPTGKSLCVVVAVDGCREIEVSIPCHWYGRVSALCRSARVEPPAADDWDETVLVGKAVSLETKQRTSAKNTEYVAVEKWLPGAPPPPAATRQPARTAPKKADAAAKAEAPDDIPF